MSIVGIKTYNQKFTQIISMLSKGKRRSTAKIWLESKGDLPLGKDGAAIVEAIKNKKSISKAAESIGMSYRYVWNYLARTERTLGKPIVRRFKGGSGGGGGVELTQLGEDLLKEYKRVENYVGEILRDEEDWEAIRLKISARNRLEGVVKSVEKGDIVGKVKMEVTVPTTITALISKEAIEDLKIKTGDKVEAVIKSTEVMIAKE